MDQKLTLINVGNGELETKFQEMYQNILESLHDSSEKATIDIKLQFNRVKDTTTMVAINHTIKATYPPTKKQSFCQENGEGELLTDKPKIKENKTPLNFAGQEATA